MLIFTFNSLGWRAMEGTSCLTFTNIYCPLGIAFPSFLCSPTCGKVFIHLPAIHLIVSFLLALQFFYDFGLQTGMKNDKLSVQIWWHYPLVIRLPSRSLLILAYRELELEKLDLTTHYQLSLFGRQLTVFFSP